MIGPASAAGTAVRPPSAAATPVDPVVPVDPIDPIADPIDPVGPIEPVGPIDPVDPVGPPSAPGAPTVPVFCPLGVDVEPCFLLPLPPLSHAAVQSAIANDVLSHREGE
jgi:hypothetical protein